MGSITLAPSDPGYPPALSVLADAGEERPVLYLRGALPKAPGVAVVGTRKATAPAMEFTRELVTELAAAGYAIWSGGALGIDAAAHEAALAAGAPTVVVMGGGLDWPYPKQHVPLYDRVLAAGGALLSRVPDEVAPMPVGFLRRNAILAAMTVVTVVIEAGLNSGARSTAAAARRFGRPLGVVPHAPWIAEGAGCALEIRSGARLIFSAADVLAAAGVTPPAPLAQKRKPKVPRGALGLPFGAGRPEADPLRNVSSDPNWTTPEAAPDDSGPARTAPPLDPLDRDILASISDVPTHLDEICERSGAPLPRVVGALLTLTLRAVVVEGPAGFFRQAHRP